jgi:hypothetical protein
MSEETIRLGVQKGLSTLHEDVKGQRLELAMTEPLGAVNAASYLDAGYQFQTVV